jgi:hypothetical protein
MTAYCCDKPSYLAVRKELGAVWRQLMGPRATIQP